MTGHDLDLDAWERRCTAAEKRATGRAVTRAEVRADSREIRALLAEVESLRAKLAAAEQERDEIRQRYDDMLTVASREIKPLRSALAAVRAACAQLDPNRYYGGGGDPNLEIFKRTLLGTLAAAEQSEPTPEQP